MDITENHTAFVFRVERCLYIFTGLQEITLQNAATAVGFNISWIFVSSNVSKWWAEYFLDHFALLATRD